MVVYLWQTWQCLAFLCKKYQMIKLFLARTIICFMFAGYTPKLFFNTELDGDAPHGNPCPFDSSIPTSSVAQ
jgi:hypothetical protein